MNKYDYRKEIDKLNFVANELNDIATKLGDDQNQMDNSGDISARSSEVTLLFIAEELIRKVIPK